MPNALVLFDVEQAIRSALTFHQQHPFFILREVGAVADLRERIRSGPSVRAPTHAMPMPNGRYRYGDPHLLVDRVQLEISVRHRKPKFKKSIDLAVLRPEPFVTFGKNGPGDVLEQVQLEDIDVAIEVKTSQSADPESRGSYVQDIYALLRLRERSLAVHPDDPAHAYFVLVDRNDPVYGQWERPNARMGWTTEVEQVIVFRKKGERKLRISGGLLACGLGLSDTQPVSTDVWIQCFILDSSRVAPLRLYVFIQDGEPPATLKPYVVSDGTVDSASSSAEWTKDSDETVGGH